MDALLDVVTASWVVVCQMAPYLLLGFGVSGLLYVFVSPAWVERHLGGRGLSSILKAALLGVPLPLCSCGVIPVTASIRAHGASRGATLSFLLSTPQTGVDSIFATYALLGPVFAVFRPVVALVTGVLGGLAASMLEPDAGRAPQEGEASEAESDSCHSPTQKRASFRERLPEAIRYGFVTLPRDIGRPLALGVVVAGLIAAFVEEGFLGAYLGGGLTAMLAMAVVGMPLYVCATASIPLALGFMHMGASPGAALVFLIAGPATNAATVSVVWKVLGRRTAIVYFVTILVASIASGLLLDALASWSSLPMLTVDSHHQHGEGMSAFAHAWGVLLTGVVAWAFVSKRLRGSKGLTAATEQGAVARVELRVEGMTCSHCVNAVTRALREVAGVQDAVVELESKRATVVGEGLHRDALVKKVQELGYSATAV